MPILIIHFHHKIPIWQFLTKYSLIHIRRNVCFPIKKLIGTQRFQFSANIPSANHIEKRNPIPSWILFPYLYFSFTYPIAILLNFYSRIKYKYLLGKEYIYYGLKLIRRTDVISIHIIFIFGKYCAYNILL